MFRLLGFVCEVKSAFIEASKDEQAGLLEQLTPIRVNLWKYMKDMKDEECVPPYLPELVKDVLTLLVTTGKDEKYKDLVVHAIQFLTVVAEKFKHNALFANPDMMNDIFQNVIIPNMELRVFDEYIFEHWAEGYIHLDTLGLVRTIYTKEGSDTVSRRHAVFKLVQALSFHFEPQMTTILNPYIEEMLEKYSRNPQVEWKSKVAAIFLFTALNGNCQTQKESIHDFYKLHISPELNNPDVNQFPVLKAEAIKYLMTLCSQLPVSTLKESLPSLINLATSSSYVVYAYAASAFEKIIVKSTVGQTLLENLFGMLAKPAAQENEYVIMKAIMRTLSTLQKESLPIMDDLLTNFIEMIRSVANKTIKSPFNHYLFESLCLYIRIIGQSSPASVKEYEAALLPLFQKMVEDGVSDCIPYVFQVLAVMLDSHSSVTEPYMTLFPSLTAPAIWEKSANITPLVRLLQTFIEKGPEQVAASDKLGALLGVFQKLIASKLNDHEGFILVQSLIENMPAAAMLNYLKQVFMLLFQRLTSSKTLKFVKCLLVYFGTFIIKYGAVNFIETIDSIQPNFMVKVLNRTMIPDLRKVFGTTDKRICAVGVTKLLCDGPEYLINGPYAAYWAPLLQALVQLFDPPEEQSGSDDDQSESEDEHFGELNELRSGKFYKWPSTTTCFRLSFGRKIATDPLKDTVPDVKMFFVQSLEKLSAANPGMLHPLITAIAPQIQNLLFEFLAAANIQLV